MLSSLVSRVEASREEGWMVEEKERPRGQLVPHDSIPPRE